MLDVLFVWFFPNGINKFIVWPCQILLDKKLLKILRRNWVKSVFTYLQTFYSIFLIKVSTLFSKLKLLESFTTNIISTCDNFLFFCRIDQHCVNLSVFSLNAGKYGPEKTPYLDTFHTVQVWQSLYLVTVWPLCNIFNFEPKIAGWEKTFFFSTLFFSEIAIMKLFSLSK